MVTSGSICSSRDMVFFSEIKWSVICRCISNIVKNVAVLCNKFSYSLISGYRYNIFLPCAFLQAWFLVEKFSLKYFLKSRTFTENLNFYICHFHFLSFFLSPLVTGSFRRGGGGGSGGRWTEFGTPDREEGGRCTGGGKKGGKKKWRKVAERRLKGAVNSYQSYES